MFLQETDEGVGTFIVITNVNAELCAWLLLIKELFLFE